MAPRVRSSKLESRSARLRLPRRKKPYSVPVLRGVHLHYRYSRYPERRSAPSGSALPTTTRGGREARLAHWQAQDLAPRDIARAHRDPVSR